LLISIGFQKFKQFSNVNIPLLDKGVTFVAGGNNSGKSTLLQGLAVWEFCHAVIEAERGPGAFFLGSRHSGIGMSYDEFSPINIPSLRHLWTNLYPQKTQADQDGYTIRISCSWKLNETPKILEFGLALANDRLFIKTTNTNLTNGDRVPRLAYLPSFAGITNRETRLPRPIQRRKIGEGLAGSVLRNILLNLQQRNSQERIKLRANRTKLTDIDLRNLRNTDPWELLQQVLRTTFNTELIVAPFKEEYHSYITIEVAKGDVKGYKLTRFPSYKNRDLMVEGSGFLQWLSVYALATDPEIDILLLDEPDAHLHCSLQELLISKLIELTNKTQKQVLIATHSTEVLKRSSPERILELSCNRPPRYLTTENQKVGLLSGLGTAYAPRIDAIMRTKHLLFVEGDFDYTVLKKITQKLGKMWPNEWIEWVNKAGHKERKHLFLALEEEITDLKAISIRDRDDIPINSVGDLLEDKSIDKCPVNLTCKLWRRRNIESYLIWPQAIADTACISLQEVEKRLQEQFGIAVGDSFVQRNAPEALLQVDGKQILKTFAIDPLKVAEKIPYSKIPEDLISIIDGLSIT
jgi:predicted ATPase